MALWLTLLLTHALAGWSVDKGPDAWTFSAEWRDTHSRQRSVQFELPSEVVRADMERPIQPSLRGLHKAIVGDVRAFAKTLPADVRLTAHVVKGAVRTEVTGPRGAAKRALRDAQDRADEAAASWALAQGYVQLDAGLTFNHAAEVNRYAKPLATLAATLRAKSKSPRAFVALALSMVQSLPYEARLWKGGDPGFRPPIALLGRRRGDCDSKTVLFLALVRAAYPELPLAVIYVPNHALAGVGLAPERGDKVLKASGTRFVVAEPVGPAQQPLGQAGRQSRLGKRQMVVVPGK